jgi:hydrogenase/urease accessory protein HupE
VIGAVSGLMLALVWWTVAFALAFGFGWAKGHASGSSFGGLWYLVVFLVGGPFACLGLAVGGSVGSSQQLRERRRQEAETRQWQAAAMDEQRTR